MTISNLPRLLNKCTEFAAAAAYTETDTDFTVAQGLRAPLIAEIYRRRIESKLTGALLVITASGRELQLAEQALKTLIPEAATVTVTAWETLPHERLSPSKDTVGKRFRALSAIRLHNSAAPLIVFASVRAVLQAVSPFTAYAEPITLSAGVELGDTGEFASQLTQLGYDRVDMVTRRGEFAVRGGIIDVFVPSAPAAVRIDCFGDEIESLHEFAVAAQRSADRLDKLEVWPARELLLTERVRKRAAELLSAGTAEPEMLAKIASGVTVEGMESLLPQLVERQYALSELLPEQSMAVVFAPERVASRAVSLAETNAEFLAAGWQHATEAQKPVAQLVREAEKTGLFTLNRVRELGGADFTWHTVSSYDSGSGSLADAAGAGAAAATSDGEPGAGAENLETSAGAVSAETSADAGAADAGEVRAVDVTPVQSDTVRVNSGLITQAAHTDAVTNAIAQLKSWFANVAESSRYAVLAMPDNGMVKRVTELLSEAEIPVTSVAQLPVAPEPGIAYVIEGGLEGGFTLPAAGVMVLTEVEFFGRRAVARAVAAQRPARARAKNVVDPLHLKAGDYVVHEVHGIGRFVELTDRTLPGGGGRVKREYLVLEYAPSKRSMPADKLYVPIDQLSQLSKYVGGETPALSKMGGSDWANTKKRARKAVRELAVELVKLYSARAHATGHAFSPDTAWQAELEDSFAYVETPDQLTAIADVKRDMERSRPMDRLISGDVGFGKTEIAVRAAFKAVQDNKQVAVLVPTTLLVKQHFETFQSRFAAFPVRLRALSRFQSDKEAREILEQLEAGLIDVIIGTHRLLGKNVKYHDLGLIIIDEEQRFGVEHKEILKDMKQNVDVLSMSATPIPRTLEMAVTGIREMSTLATAPEDRHPILTFVGQRNDVQTAAAIRREMLRDGQVFYVHNRVAAIHRVAKRVAELVPEARVAVAHGRLSQEQLEKVVVDFYEREYDVLVCTTIVETGLDIANANTIIVDNADKYGLGQLHQLRGRVGRSRERAYAYFLYESTTQLTEHAYERLETIATHNELGSGMQVALQDLELRGAGNLLGGEQSGHITGVGFDLYLRMISEAIDTFKGEDVQEARELNIVLPVAAYIPEDYIDSERLRLEAYQKFAAAAHPQAAAENVSLVVEELQDRYGTLPAPVVELARLSQLRRTVSLLGVLELKFNAGVLQVSPVQLPDSKQMRLRRLYPRAEYARGVLTVPAPEALLGGAKQLSASRFSCGLKAADQALDGDILGWVSRFFANIVEE
ncbi:transcription-repair coupling factor [Canibacter sp. lx-72]|uniref:transcription-repair coupling factor n=1 Tax=Canibacter zhuwentaonis TaxID=2837491 RepID=UPI001BDDBE5C|nr:transcription-repair coupling factor [Canibacter zhuwentaonis]MBT1018278.1 transcription-repair coupling factor [Canibacter zhuwentaonis]